MRKFQKAEGSGRGLRARGLSILITLAMTLVACSLDKSPDRLGPMIEPLIPQAVSLAKSSAPLCATVKAGGTIDDVPAASPAAGTALATDPAVAEILVRCVWAGDAEGDDARSHTAGLMFDFPPLRGVPRQNRGTPPTLVHDSRVDPGDPAFERVHVPSRYSALGGSADIKAIEPTPDGGSVEVIVSVKQ